MKKYYFLLTLSTIGLVWGLMVNAQTMAVLNNAVIAVYSGYGLKNFLDPVVGLLANGNIKLVSPIIVKATLFLSLVFMYVSVFKIVNKDNNNRLRDIFTMAYWRHVDVGIVYKPVKIKR
jgi:hypothetical protein